MALFVLMVIFVAIGAYIVNVKGLQTVNYGTVAVDYLQLLAIFARADITWPVWLLRFFDVLSAFSLDINITAPECLVNGLDFRLRWFGTMVLPLAAASILGVVFLAVYTYRSIVMGAGKDTRCNHLGPTISTLFMLYYVTHLLITRTALDVFACEPPLPSDGRGILYMTSTAVPCYEPGGLHMQLLPVGIIALLVYNGVIPVLIGWWLYTNRDAVIEDQYLRAANLGNTKSSNPHYEFRRANSRMYSFFVPKYSYMFMLVLLARKFLFAATGILFQSNASFQLAFALLVTFYSFVITVSWRPYLCYGEHARVLSENDRLARAGDHYHAKILDTLR